MSIEWKKQRQCCGYERGTINDEFPYFDEAFDIVHACTMSSQRRKKKLWDIH